MKRSAVLALLATLAGCGSVQSGVITGGLLGAAGEGGVGYAIAPSGKQGRAAAVGSAAGAVSGALIMYGLHRLGLWQSDSESSPADVPGFDGRPGSWLLTSDLDSGSLTSTTAAQEWRAWRRKRGFGGAAVIFTDLLETSISDRFLGIYGSYPTEEEAHAVSNQERFHELPFHDSVVVIQTKLKPGPGVLPRLVEVVITLPEGPAERTSLDVTTPERTVRLRAAPGGEASIWVAHAGKVSATVSFPAGDASNPPEHGRCFEGSTHEEVTIDDGDAGPPATTSPIGLALGHHAVACPR